MWSQEKTKKNENYKDKYCGILAQNVWKKLRGKNKNFRRVLFLNLLNCGNSYYLFELDTSFFFFAMLALCREAK